MAANRKANRFEKEAIVHLDIIYNAALKLTKSRVEAEDLVQETFLRAYRFFDKFKAGTNCKAWLFKILKNIYINKYRKESRKPQMLDVSDVEGSGDLANALTPEDEIFGKLLDDDVVDAMDALPEEFRLAIVLSDLEGFSYKEIAEILDCPIGTVMSRLHRGRKLLQKVLYDYAVKNGYIKENSQ